MHVFIRISSKSRLCDDLCRQVMWSAEVYVLWLPGADVWRLWVGLILWLPVSQVSLQTVCSEHTALNALCLAIIPLFLIPYAVKVNQSPTINQVFSVREEVKLSRGLKSQKDSVREKSCTSSIRLFADVVLCVHWMKCLLSRAVEKKGLQCSFSVCVSLERHSGLFAVAVSVLFGAAGVSTVVHLLFSSPYVSVQDRLVDLMSVNKSTDVELLFDMTMVLLPPVCV